MEELIIDINADGSVTIEGENFVDGECKELSKQLEADLGVVTKTVEKPQMRATRSRTTARKLVR